MILFINSCFREGSRTKALAEHYIKRYDEDVVTLEIGDMNLRPLLRDSLKTYNDAVGSAIYSDMMFDMAKQFAVADEIIIAAPYWNFGIPAALHTYIELVCTQGLTFDVNDDGSYFSLCRAKKLVYITTAGGYIPDEDHAYCFIKYLADTFWCIDDVKYYKADGLDIVGNNVEKLLKAVKDEMDGMD